MPEGKDTRKAQGEIDLETYLAVKSRLARDDWAIAGLIREAFALYLNGEITKPDETPAEGETR